jgi:hypothetical protein
MVIKKTESKPKKRVTSPRAVKSIPLTVVAKTTKPKVVVQTKKLNEPLPHAYVPVNEPCCHRPHVGKRIGKVLIIILLLANLFFSYLIYKNVQEQQVFLVNSNGGKENYEMLKNIYSTPEFQQASTMSVYQLVERINQTLAPQTPTEPISESFSQ